MKEQQKTLLRLTLSAFSCTSWCSRSSFCRFRSRVLSFVCKPNCIEMLILSAIIMCLYISSRTPWITSARARVLVNLRLSDSSSSNFSCWDLAFELCGCWFCGEHLKWVKQIDMCSAIWTAITIEITYNKVFDHIQHRGLVELIFLLITRNKEYFYILWPKYYI